MVVIHGDLTHVVPILPLEERDDMVIFSDCRMIPRKSTVWVSDDGLPVDFVNEVVLQRHGVDDYRLVSPVSFLKLSAIVMQTSEVGIDIKVGAYKHPKTDRDTPCRSIHVMETDFVLVPDATTTQEAIRVWSSHMRMLFVGDWVRDNLEDIALVKGRWPVVGPFCMDIVFLRGETGIHTEDHRHSRVIAMTIAEWADNFGGWIPGDSGAKLVKADTALIIREPNWDQGRDDRHSAF